MPRNATSLEELEAIVARVSREHRWEAIERIAASLDLDLRPDEIWLFTRLGRDDAPVRLDALAGEFAISHAELERLADRLAARGLASRGAGGELAATEKGRGTYRRMVTRYRARLTELVERWHPRNHAEVRTMLNEFAQGLIADLPLAPQPLDG